MPIDESSIAATISIIQTLARGDYTSHLDVSHFTLPGADSAEKTALERELAALIARSRLLELKAEHAVQVQQATEEYSKALREISEVVTAFAKGDFGKKFAVHATEMDPEITNLKNTINSMIDRLRNFAVELTRIGRQTGTEGKLGGCMIVNGLEGSWNELSETVNLMTSNLTNQLRDMADYLTLEVANGNVSREKFVHAQGELLELQQAIITMAKKLQSLQ